MADWDVVSTKPIGEWDVVSDAPETKADAPAVGLTDRLKSFGSHMLNKAPMGGYGARVLAQVPLGVAREAIDMVKGAAPAMLAEAQAMNPNMKLSQQDNSLFGEDAGTEALRPEVYEKQGEQFKKDVGIEGAMTPRNLPEKMASAAGKALPWAPLGAGPEGVLPMAAIQMASGASGEAVHETFPELGPWGRVLGSVVGALGADKVANVLMRGTRPQEFGIPLTKGQRMLSEEHPRAPSQVALEEDIRKGGKGYPAQVLMNRFDQQQRRAAQDAVEEVGEGLGGLPQTAGEAGHTVDEALKVEAQRRQAMGSKHYESAAAREATVHPEAVEALPLRTQLALESDGFRLSDMNNISHPQSLRMLGIIERYSNSGKDISTRSMEAIRKQFVKIFPNTRTEDGLAAKIIKDSYDEWEHGVVVNKLIAGDPKALDDLVQARGYWRQYKDMTGRTKGADAVIAKIVNGEKTPEEVANLVIGASSAGGGSMASAVIQRIKSILGPDSDAIKSLRQAVFDKLVHDRASVHEVAEETARTPIQIARQIKKFLHSDSSAPVARELFSAEERRHLNDLANALGRTTPKPVNPSGSGSTAARLALPLAQVFGGLGIGAAGHYYTGSPYAYAMAAAPWIRDANAVRQVLNATRDVPKNVIPYRRAVAPALAREGYEMATGEE